jgi:hypothetical protein
LSRLPSEMDESLTHTTAADPIEAVQGWKEGHLEELRS